MTYVHKFGLPDLFITFTCNQKWVEIERELEGTNTTARLRHDIISHVFKRKQNELMRLLKDANIFDKMLAYSKICF